MTDAQVRSYVPVVLLAMTAGAVDAVSFLGLGGVFSSVMTANLVLLGLSAAEHSGELAVHAASSFAGYLAGALAASRLAGKEGPPKRTTMALAGEFVVLAGFTVGWETSGGHPHGWAQLLLLATAALAMGAQSATVIAFKLPGVSTTYMTGMLTGVLGDLATPARHEVRLRLTLLAMLIAGAVASGFAYTEEPRLAPLVILTPIAFALTVKSLATARHQDSVQT
ncbi:MAG TPA: YoaK family protein [Streptosporangiaceae bacterium]|nr:YoaK family protein [Streptosporangiaceae bacterium]